MDGLAIIVIIGLFAYYQEEHYKNTQNGTARKK